MAKHTPGPWHYNSENWMVMTEERGEYICEISYPFHVDSDANASLIAAAPDLLEALKQCRQVILMEHTLNSDYGWLDFINEHIQPALDKAEGNEDA